VVALGQSQDLPDAFTRQAYLFNFFWESVALVLRLETNCWAIQLSDRWANQLDLIKDQYCWAWQPTLNFGLLQSREVMHLCEGHVCWQLVAGMPFS